MKATLMTVPSKDLCIIGMGEKTLLVNVDYIPVVICEYLALKIFRIGNFSHVNILGLKFFYTLE